MKFLAITINVNDLITDGEKKGIEMKQTKYFGDIVYYMESVGK